MNVTFEELNDKTFFKHFQGIKRAFLTKPENFLFLDNFPSVLKKLKSYQAREDDIYLVSFCKSGTALMQEILHLLFNGTDVEEARNSLRDYTFPYLELHMWNLNLDVPIPDGFEILENASSPRMIKTHLPYSHLPQSIKDLKCKIIYVYRNIKDVIVSFYHFTKHLSVMNFTGNFHDFAELFLADRVPYSPYIAHVKGYWQRRNEPRILMISFEEMMVNFNVVVKTVADFLGKSITEEELVKIAHHCNFENMKGNSSVNKHYWRTLDVASKDFQYLRKGIIGDWKNYFSQGLSEKCSKWLDKEADQELKVFLRSKL